MAQETKILLKSNWIKDGDFRSSSLYQRLVVLLISYDGKPYEISVTSEMCDDPKNYENSSTRKWFGNGSYFNGVTTINEQVIDLFNRRLSSMIEIMLPKAKIVTETKTGKKMLSLGIMCWYIDENPTPDFCVNSTITKEETF